MKSGSSSGESKSIVLKRNQIIFILLHNRRKESRRERDGENIQLSAFKTLLDRILEEYR